MCVAFSSSSALALTDARSLEVHIRNLRVLAVEDLGNLFQWWTTCLNVENLHKDELEAHQACVDNVELVVIRSLGIKRERIALLVDGQLDLKPEIHNHLG